MTRMYHTMLPLDERRALRREYRFRVIIVACFMLCLSGIVGIGALFPAYSHAVSSLRASENELLSLKKDTNKSDTTTIERNLAINKTLLAPLYENLNESHISTLIQVVVSARGDISITSMDIARAASSTATLTIKGVAQTRESLLSFKSRLESVAPGNKVNLPVSQLSKNSNIPFSLQVTALMP